LVPRDGERAIAHCGAEEADDAVVFARAEQLVELGVFEWIPEQAVRCRDPMARDGYGELRAHDRARTPHSFVVRTRSSAGRQSSTKYKGSMVLRCRSRMPKLLMMPKTAAQIST